jgi:hypothetical protein
VPDIRNSTICKNGCCIVYAKVGEGNQKTLPRKEISFGIFYGYGPEHVDKGEYIHNYRYFFLGGI